MDYYIPKVGDWVVVTEQYNQNKSKKGAIGQIRLIDNYSKAKYQIHNSYDFKGTSWCENVRKVEFYEIPKNNETINNIPNLQNELIKSNNVLLLDTVIQPMTKEEKLSSIIKLVKPKQILKIK